MRIGAPGRIRTCGLKLRRLLLYPTELRARDESTYQQIVRLLKAPYSFSIQRDRSMPLRNKGVGMRTVMISVGGLATLAAASPASAATIIIYTDPMTLERRTVVIDTNGPDRAFLCMRPPGVAGCQEIPVKRRRG
jgi:hypothetical protein